MSMKKACIIGGYGNIGLGVSRKMVSAGYDVTVVSRSRSEKNPVEETKWLQLDRKDSERFVSELKAGEYEYVIDLACFTAADAQIDYRAFPNVRHIIFVSSGASYGYLNACEIPIREHMVQKPVWGYGITKKEAEDFLFEKFRTEGYPVTVFRPTVTYGRQNVIPRQIGMDNSWIDRIRKGKPIVTGNPYILRNFLYNDDAAGAFVGAFNHEWCIGQAYNLGAMRCTDWGTYHRTMMEIIGREVEMVEVPVKVQSASPHFEVSPMITTNYLFNGFYAGDKIARDIPEFCPETSLKDGLSHALEYLDANNLIPDSDAISWEDEMIEAQNRALDYMVSLRKQAIS